MIELLEKNMKEEMNGDSIELIVDILLKIVDHLISKNSINKTDKIKH